MTKKKITITTEVVNENLEANENLRLPTSTVHQARLRVFEPTRRATYKERINKTEWGYSRILGKLGQVHADFIEAIFFHAEKIERYGSGQVVLIVDPYKVRMSMGGGKQYSHKALKIIAENLRSGIIEIKIKDKGMRTMGGIIDNITESTISKINPMNKEKERFMWKVAVNSLYVSLMREDLNVRYDPLPIAQLDSGISQAIVRFCKGHKNSPNGGWILDNLIFMVGAINTDSSPQVLRDRRREVRKDATKMQKCGVILDENNRVHLVKDYVKDKILNL